MFWLIIAAVLVVIEAATVQLVCIWFTIGSVLAAIASFAGAPFWLQLLIGLIASIAVLIVGRPLLLEKVLVRKQPTNADRLLGQYGVVTEEINNLRQTGRVSADGQSWKAVSERGEIVPEGAPVGILFIDGVKLVVRPLPHQRPPEPPKAEPAPAPENHEAQSPSELYTTPDIPDAPSLDRE